MKLALALFLVFTASFATAAVKEGQVFYVPVEPAKYQLGTGKAATIEMQIAFFSKEDAEAANQNPTKLKTALANALKASKIDSSTKNGKMLLGAEVATKLQESGFRAQTILWNSFIF